MLKHLMKVLELVLNRLLLLLVIFMMICVLESNKVSEKTYKLDIAAHNSTLDSIYNEILRLKLDYPNLVYSQIILETGYLSSDLYKKNNNLFGMRASGSRATTSTIIVDGYKWYPHWKESLLDYALLQMAFYRNKTKKEYYEKLNRVYAEDPYYTDKLKFIEEKLLDPST